MPPGHPRRSVPRRAAGSGGGGRFRRRAAGSSGVPPIPAGQPIPVGQPIAAGVRPVAPSEAAVCRAVSAGRTSTGWTKRVVDVSGRVVLDRSSSPIRAGTADNGTAEALSGLQACGGCRRQRRRTRRSVDRCGAVATPGRDRAAVAAQGQRKAARGAAWPSGGPNCAATPAPRRSCPRPSSGPARRPPRPPGPRARPPGRRRHPTSGTALRRS